MAAVNRRKKLKGFDKFILFFLIFGLITAMAAGCGSGGDRGGNSNGGNNGQSGLEGLPAITITYAHANPADPANHEHAAALAFKRTAESLSGGKITVNIAPARQLGTTQELLELVITGEIEITGSQTDGTVALIYPDIMAMSIPYLFDNIWHAMYITRPSESEFGREFYEAFRKETGLRVLALFNDGSFMNFSNNIRPVRTPDDLRGVRVRTMPIGSHMEIVTAAGASVTPIAWAELYTALETGVVDGAKTTVATMIMGSLHEVQKYLTLDRHQHLGLHVLANDDWFQGLPRAYQDIILKAGREAEYAGQRQAEIMDVVGLSLARKAGMQVYQPTPEELEKFRAVLQQPVIDFIRKEIPNPEWVDRILNATREARSLFGLDKVE